MFKNLASAKLGIFIFIGSTLLVAAIFLLGNKDALFKSTFTVQAYFKNIEGLRNGAVVRLSGIDVGSVKSIEIADDTTGRIEVSMRLITDIERFIRKDTKASIETEGLVGNKVIILQIGTSASEQVKDGGVIQSKEPLGFAEIIEETQGIMEYTKEMTKNLSEIVARVNRGEGSIGKLLNDEELYNNATMLTETADRSLNAITKELEEVTEIFKELGSGVQEVVANVNQAVVDVDTIIGGVRKGEGFLGSLLIKESSYDSVLSATLSNIQQISEDGKLAASRLAENMEALKHNWLFKSYFEDRGYWDKAEYEDEINNNLIELDKKIKMLDERIEQLKALEEKKN
ncbi:MAG: MCE family protein [Ignavibacteriales bacterium]|nr:MAG: MCE family protein [Ignavibacteriales bacterium]